MNLGRSNKKDIKIEMSSVMQYDPDDTQTSYSPRSLRSINSPLRRITTPIRRSNSSTRLTINETVNEDTYHNNNHLSHTNRNKYENVFISIFVYMYTILGWPYVIYVHAGKKIFFHYPGSETDFFVFSFNLLLFFFLFYITNYKYIKTKKKAYVFSYIILYGLGLQFSYLDKIPVLQTFILNSKHFNLNNELHSAILASIVLSINFLFLYQIYIYRKLKKTYIGISLWFGTGIVFSLFSFYYLEKYPAIHFHHYLVALIYMISCLNPSKLAFMVQTISLAVFVDGVSVYGYAPLYDK